MVTLPAVIIVNDTQSIYYLGFTSKITVRNNALLQ